MGLFTPAWKSENLEKRMKAVKKITEFDVETISNQALLKEVALLGSNKYVCEPALKKITDENVLFIIIKTIAAGNRDGYRTDKGDLIELAVQKITNQALLVDIIKNVRNPRSELREMRELAIEKITEPNLLVDIAKNAPLYYSRRLAIEKIEDETFLAYVAKNDKDDCVRYAAVEKINDNFILAEIAKKGYDDTHQFRRLAVKRLTEQVCLLDVATNAEDARVRAMAASKIIEDKYKPILEERIKKEASVDVRTAICLTLGGHILNGCQCDRCGVEQHSYEFLYREDKQISRTIGVETSYYKCRRCRKERQDSVGGEIDCR